MINHQACYHKHQRPAIPHHPPTATPPPNPVPYPQHPYNIATTTPTTPATAPAPTTPTIPVGFAPAAAPPFDIILCSALMTDEIYFLSSEGRAAYQEAVVTAGSKAVSEDVRSLLGSAVLSTLATDVHAFCAVSDEM